MSIINDGAQALVQKPHIYLVGNRIGDDRTVSEWSGRVDNASPTIPSSTTSVSSVSNLNKEDLLTFDQSVRVIITGQNSPKPTYVRQNGGLFSSTSFEGNETFDTGGDNKDEVNYLAETWYTLNGKDPIRSKAFFYNFRDMDDYSNLNPSGYPVNNGNITTLGFVLRTNPTGSDLVTLKAKTYWRSEESSIAIAVFKIAIRYNNREFYQTPR